MNPLFPIIVCLSATPVPMVSVHSQDDRTIAAPAQVTSDVEAARIESLEVDPTESEVDRRVREALNAANTRYWRNRVRMKTLPDDRWTPQQAGWIDASGRLLVVNWPWWAW